MMTLFENIINEIIGNNETGNPNVTLKKIEDAIRNHWATEIKYQSEIDTDKKHVRKRYIFPVAYGVSKSGNDVIRAFQSMGDTNTVIPKWKFFRIDRIKSWVNKPKTNFDTKKLGDANSPYNPNGDKSMTKIYMQATTGKGKILKSKNIKPISKAKEEKPIITPNPITKTDIKNIEKNIDNDINNTYNNKNITNQNTLKTNIDKPILKADLSQQDNNLQNVTNNTVYNINKEKDNENLPINFNQSDLEIDNSVNNNENLTADDGYVTKNDLQQVSNELKEWNKRLGNFI